MTKIGIRSRGYLALFIQLGPEAASPDQRSIQLPLGR
jgi:hypothetical protein